MKVRGPVLTVHQKLEKAEETIQQLAKELMDAINEPMYSGSRDDWMNRAYAAETRLDDLTKKIQELPRYMESDVICRSSYDEYILADSLDSMVETVRNPKT